MISIEEAANKCSQLYADTFGHQPAFLYPLPAAAGVCLFRQQRPLLRSIGLHCLTMRLFCLLIAGQARAAPGVRVQIKYQLLHHKAGLVDGLQRLTFSRVQHTFTSQKGKSS